MRKFIVAKKIMNSKLLAILVIIALVALAGTVLAGVEGNFN